MNYPPPEDNLHCQCKGNPGKAFFCQTGHLTECHFPYDCDHAGCGHLHKYDYSAEEALVLQTTAYGRLALGELIGYDVDDWGNPMAVETERPLMELMLQAIVNVHGLEMIDTIMTDAGFVQVGEEDGLRLYADAADPTATVIIRLGPWRDGAKN
ncbi:MAG: hypothetical protein KF770_17560 [Anaerolineae bacterium]|nr:hypothetical protein [Anaerolineae bacterium]